MDTGTKCPVCGDAVLEISRKHISDKVTSLFGFYCNTCDYDFFGVLEWAIKNQQ